MRKAKIALFILTVFVAIETAHILVLHLVEIPAYDAAIQDLRLFLEQAKSKEKIYEQIIDYLAGRAFPNGNDCGLFWWNAPGPLRISAQSGQYRGPLEQDAGPGQTTERIFGLYYLSPWPGPGPEE